MHNKSTKHKFEVLLHRAILGLNCVPTLSRYAPENILAYFNMYVFAYKMQSIPLDFIVLTQTTKMVTL